MATESGDYKETKCMYLGCGSDKFPEEYKSRFDVVVASGIWLVGHVPSAAMEDGVASLKVGGLFVTSMRKSYWVNGQAQGYKDCMDKMIAEGKIEITKQFDFMRGIPNNEGDPLYAEQPSLLIVCTKL